jgi:hypothetical protein
VAWSDFFKRSGAKPQYRPDPTLWPNMSIWSAGKDKSQAIVRGKYFPQWVVPCGELEMSSGNLVACDPFAAMDAKNNAFIRVPKGRHPVAVTLVDVSERHDRSNVREAYASIFFQKGEEAYRKAISPAVDDKDRVEPQADEFRGFGVDSGTACFVDAWSIEHCMPDSSTWYDELFENSQPECWFKRMDDPNHTIYQ